MAVPTWTSGQVLTASDVNTWFVPIVAIKTSTESVTSSTTLQNDDQLVIALAANSTYEINGEVIYDGDQATGDFKIGFTGPAGATVALHFQGVAFSGTGFTDYRGPAYRSFGGGEAFGALGTGTDVMLGIHGIVSVGGSAGNLQLQWAQNGSSATATRVFGLSFLNARRIS